MNKLMLFLVGITLVACTEISYKEPQPAGVKALSKIPTRLYGNYLMDGDTVTLFEKGMRGKEPGKEEEFLLLSDSIILKEYKGLYFASYRDGNVWLLRILRREKNGDLMISMMDNVPDNQEQRKVFIENLSKEIPVIQSGEHFIIEPSPKKLYSLVQKGFFKERQNVMLKKI